MTLTLCHHDIDVNAKADTDHHNVNTFYQAVKIQVNPKDPELKDNFKKEEGNNAQTETLDTEFGHLQVRSSCWILKK